MKVGQLESGLAGAMPTVLSAAVQTKLLELYPALVPSLAAALEARMKQLVDGLQNKLADRGDSIAFRRSTGSHVPDRCDSIGPRSDGFTMNLMNITNQVEQV